MAGLLTEKIRESQKRKGLLDLWSGLLTDTGLPELFSGKIGGQTLEQGIQNRLQPNSLRPALSPQQMVNEGLNIAGVAPIGMFIGKGAQTWDVAKNAIAQQMEKAGKPPREIWAKTGNWKAPDGKWRQEIPDNDVFQYGPVTDLAVPIKKRFALDELEKAYPQEAMLPVSGGQLQFAGDSAGSFNNGKITINGKNQQSTALHELQHAIQQREGWARGGSPKSVQWLGDDAQKRIDEINGILNSGKYDMNQYDALLQEKRNLINASDLTPYDAYRRLAGEAEARATQARMNMDMPQRLQTFPADSYDVPLDQLIVRYGDGPAMSAPMRPRNALGQEIPPTQYELAHQTAQRNAALPVEQGGLGLPEGNTAMDRARAMGFDTNSFHGTTKSFTEFDPMKRGTASDSGWYGDADYSTPSTEFANAFAVPNGASIPQEGANVMPLKINLGNTYKWRDLADDNGRGLWQNDRNSSIEMRRKLQREGYDSTTVENSTIKLGENENLTQEQWNALVNQSPIVGMIGKETIEGLMRNGYGFDTFAKSYGYDVARKMPAQKTVSEYGIFDPKNIRSRFAAFDPMKRNSSDLLAGLYPWTVPISAGLLGSLSLLPSDAEAR